MELLNIYLLHRNKITGYCISSTLVPKAVFLNEGKIIKKEKIITILLRQMANSIAIMKRTCVNFVNRPNIIPYKIRIMESMKKRP